MSRLVLGQGLNGRPIRIRVLLDDSPAGSSKGEDVDSSGDGAIAEQRLYQLIRQTGVIQAHTLKSGS